MASVAWTLIGPLQIHGWTGWRSALQHPDFWQKSADGNLMQHWRKNWQKGSQKKLCFVATNQELLAGVLEELASRPDCVYVKYSLYQKDGMYLGRCFLTDDHQVGLVWRSSRTIDACSVPYRMTISQPRFVGRDKAAEFPRTFSNPRCT